jgi:hypothetical protein
MRPLGRLYRSAAREDGITMIFALIALFVSGLLVAAAFSAASGDIALSSRSTIAAKAYYAAQAGVQRYQYQLSAEPNYWTKCPAIAKTKVPLTEDESYTTKTLGSSNASSGCTAGNQTTILETTGRAKGTFRILSTGTAGTGKEAVTRKIVATFSHPGFTKYVYESNFEVEDPTNFNPIPKECEHYYAERVTLGVTGSCPPIEWAPEDKVNGPMHTNDAAAICAEGSLAPTFGRTSADKIEMNGGHYKYPNNNCKDAPNIVGEYSEEAGTLYPPETDGELLEGAGYQFTGRTVLKLTAGNPNTITVTTSKGTETMNFPANGVIYVKNATGSCPKYTPFGSDTTGDTNCGNVYVSGSYTESLTIAAEDDVIVNGSLTTTTKSGGEPTGGATLGLIAENFVRVYHPVESEYKVTTYVPNSVSATRSPCTSTSTKKMNGTLSTRRGSTEEITGLSSNEELAVGDTVTGSGIPTGTTITSIESDGTSVGISKAVTSSKTTELTFTLPYVYYSGIKLCVEVPKAGYKYVETEKVAVEFCKEFNNAEEKYLGKAKCEYANTSSGCDAPEVTAATDPNKWGDLPSPTIDAAILSTKHSWIVDNWKCGEPLGKLTVWGSIAQFWRGPVGTGGGTGTGYIKNYTYDERLAAQQPPSFLSPTDTTWSMSRETAPPASFTG